MYCTNPQFAVVAGGHNFRPNGRNRVRHRMYHKLNGFLATHDRMLCVGCGRCVLRACKANINPIRVLKFFERKGRKVPNNVAASAIERIPPRAGSPMTGAEMMAASPYRPWPRAHHVVAS